ncbi:MAG: carbamoyltransferase HypF [Candidatus Thorarchaeota archaeon]|nr:carbamoyltransferase HypF [Candidatus Thorarchaeota archaeon]
MLIQANIHITGIVQGVGFRPFVFRMATDLGLMGYVLNLGDAGVEIIVEGEEENIKKFIRIVETKPPSISKIERIKVIWKPFTGTFTTFSIKRSDTHREPSAAPEIPPDISICDDCIRDIYSPESRWYRYPFTSCAACGPRYTTITDLPYDRPNTTMVDFPLCDSCNTGYTNPLDRRYHAQTTACPLCGPTYRILNNKGEAIHTYDAIYEAAQIIRNGYILAIHGIGGTHLVTKTSDLGPIQKLRQRKKRSTRPFAIMVKTLDDARKLAIINESEAKLLSSWRRPIVLVKKRHILPVIQAIQSEALYELAPNIDTVGIMLPYSAIHYLLLEYTKEIALVMTSGNPSGIPMYTEIDTITNRLGNIADYLLVHNRRIAQRVDDSVIKPLGNEMVFIRRSRGYVPDPIKIQGAIADVGLIAVGPEEKTTGAIYKSGTVYLTQHIGDTNNIESLDFLKSAINHMVRLVGLQKIDAIGCDLHPEFLSTEFAKTLASQNNIPVIKTQHHHAHLLSLMADNNISYNTNIVCITADGYGYGEDGTAWGGEILIGNGQNYENYGGLTKRDMPGGDLAAQYPVRAFLGIIGDQDITSRMVDLCIDAPLGPRTFMDRENFDVILSAMSKRVNSVASSSAGRFLDAVAFALGISKVNSYNGESPMKLESIAKESIVPLAVEYIEKEKRIQLDTTALLESILVHKRNGVPVPTLAYSAQWYLGEGLAEIAIRAAKDKQIEMIGFSGGVALNRIITKAIKKRVKESGLTLLLHRQVPPGDGGISLGQIIHAVSMMEVISSNTTNT